MASNNRSAILKVAENMVREGGYDAFSFRAIADVVGIKSSSIHYHFPTKEVLGSVLAKLYTDRFFDALGEPQQILDAGDSLIKKYVRTFRYALENDKQMCLCGLLGAQIDGLPESVAKEIRLFYERNIDWLTTVYLLEGGTDEQAHKASVQSLALIQGAIVMGNVLEDLSVFDDAAEKIYKIF